MIPLSNLRYLIEVDCSLDKFKSAKLKDKEYTINAPNFSQQCKKERDGWTKFLKFVGKWSAVIYVADAVSLSIR